MELFTFSNLYLTSILKHTVPSRNNVAVVNIEQTDLDNQKRAQFKKILVTHFYDNFL